MQTEELKKMARPETYEQHPYKEALNSNLKSLAGAHNFQQTAAGLSAALQLMSIHLVGKRPQRAIPHELQQRAGSLADYGVAFHACGNTMKSLGWSEEDLLPFARVVPIGVDDIMLLQERGFAYMSW